MHILNIDKAEYQLITELVERIDEIRVKNNYSIYQLANKADTSINTIKHLYKKKSFPNIHTVYNICEALEIPMWRLFYKIDNDPYRTNEEISLCDNYERLSDIGKRLLLELSENMK